MCHFLWFGELFELTGVGPSQIKFLTVQHIMDWLSNVEPRHHSQAHLHSVQKFVWLCAVGPCPFIEFVYVFAYLLSGLLVFVIYLSEVHINTSLGDCSYSEQHVLWGICF